MCMYHAKQTKNDWQRVAMGTPVPPNRASYMLMRNLVYESEICSLCINYTKTNIVQHTALHVKNNVMGDTGRYVIFWNELQVITSS